jgi:hypothetical protein
MLLLVALLAFPQVWATITGKAGTAGPLLRRTPNTRWSYAVYYLGLAAFLGVMSYQIHEGLQELRQ